MNINRKESNDCLKTCLNSEGRLSGFIIYFPGSRYYEAGKQNNINRVRL